MKIFNNCSACEYNLLTMCRALNSNKFTGGIPPTLGLLSDLTWLDLSVNQLSGQIPVSPGLNQLVNTLHL
jgi:hypothetical protein